jgi:transposase
MSAARTIPIVEVKVDQVKAALERGKKSPLSDEDHELLKSLLESYAYLTELVDDKTTTIEYLRRLLGSSKSEKTRDVLGREGADGGAVEAANGGGGNEEAGGSGESSKARRKPKGHGRNGAEAYPGAKRIHVPHATLCAGDACPVCRKGKLYELSAPSVLTRMRGSAPIEAEVYELQRLRCALCGKVFTAAAPAGVGERKYDATAASMIALLKYGSGLPFNRLAGLQGNLGIPLPPSTQWDVVQELARTLDPAYRELIRQAAQGEVLRNDDTSMKILELMGKPEAEQAESEEDSARTGTFTSGIVSTAEGWRVALFFTGRQHAGENLADVLAQRASELGAPIQMCDALSRNTSPAFETIVANCMVHARRKFVEVVENFPAECRHVLKTLGAVYGNEAEAVKLGMSPEERLRFHQAQSGPLMDGLHAWMTEQIEQRKVEPNSGLGQATRYMLKHWEKLTLFLKMAGAPLDNNLCERALKKAILHRKNSLFYKTQNGARVGDLFMSLIYTCQLVGVNAFEYLTELQNRIQDVARDPSLWMPWNYRDTLAAARGD